MDPELEPDMPLAFVHADDRRAARGWLETCRLRSICRLDELARATADAPSASVATFVAATSAAAERVAPLIGLRTPIIAVVECPAEDLAISLLEMGVDDVVSSIVSRQELRARAAAVTRRARGAAPVVVGSDLRRAEFNLFTYLLQHAGRVVSQRELVREVFGGAHTIDTTLVRVHVAHLRKKLGPRGHAIKTFRGRGYAVDATLLLSSDGEQRAA